MTNNAERETFEKWASDNYYPLDRNNNKEYVSIETEFVWLGWQARAQASGMPDGYVAMPKNESEAAGMEQIGYAWLRANAPHRLSKSANVPVERLEELKKLCARKSTVYGSGAYQEFADSLAELIAEYKV